MKESARRVLVIAVLGIVGLWSSAGVVAGAEHASAAASTPASPAVVVPAEEIGGGNAAVENITVEVTGVPQTWSAPSIGQCLTSPPDANCQVYVPLNLAFTETYSTGSDIQDVPVEPSSSAFTFSEGVGGTGFLASYNTNECNLADVPNGCFVAVPPNANYYNYAGPQSEPYFWVEGKYGPQTVFVPGCSGEPYGQIFGPNSHVSGATTIDLGYTACPGVPVDDPGDDGGNGSLNFTNGSWDPCPANGTNDTNCWNEVVVSVDFTDLSAAYAPDCPLCHDVMNNTIPVARAANGTVSTYLWNGTYHWTASFLNRSASLDHGTLTSLAGGTETIVTQLTRTHTLTFTEEGLPTGDSWSVWSNGTEMTTTNGSVTVQATNGSAPFFVLGPAGYEAGVGTAGSAFGSVAVHGPSEETVVFHSCRGRCPTLSFKQSPSLPKGDAYCVYILPTELARSTQYGDWASPGIPACSATKTVTLAVPLNESASGGGTAGAPLVASKSAPPAVNITYIAVKKQGSPTGPACKTCHIHYGPASLALPPHQNGTVEVGPHGAVVAVSLAIPKYSFQVDYSGVVFKGKWHGELVSVDPSSHKVTRFSGAGGTTGSGNVSDSLVNGTYAFVLAPVKGYIAEFGDVPSQGGLFLVAGEPVTLNVSFVLATFNVTFSETGLPGGTDWSVSIPSYPNSEDPSHDWSSTSSSITVPMPNGTYKLSVVGVSGYSDVAPKVVKVNGAAVSLSVTFAAESGGGSGAPFALSWIGAGLLVVPATLGRARTPSGRAGGGLLSP